MVSRSKAEEQTRSGTTRRPDQEAIKILLQQSRSIESTVNSRSTRTMLSGVFRTFNLVTESL